MERLWKKKAFIAGCCSGVAASVAAYVGYKLYEENKSKIMYKSTHNMISKMQYSMNDEINKMLHVIATMIELNEKGYLSTINNEDRSEYPLGCIIHKTWKPPVSIPYIYIGIDKEITTDNNAVLTFHDIDDEEDGYVSLYGKVTNIHNKQKLEIYKIEFISPRFGFVGKNQKPYILKRIESSLHSEKAKWIRAETARKWRTNYSGYLVFDDDVSHET